MDAAALALLAVPALQRHPWARPGALAVLGAGIAAALAGMAAGSAPVLAVPLGFPGVGMHLALDGLSALMLLAVLLPAAAFAASGAGTVALPTAAAMLTLLAADGLTLVLGMGLLSTAGRLHGPQPDRGARPDRAEGLGLAMAGVLCLAAALAVLGTHAADLRFAALRAAPPEGWRAASVLALLLAGLALQGWARPAGGIGVYVLIRVLLDLSGPAIPVWWGVPLLVPGMAAALWGARNACRAAELDAVVSGAATCVAGVQVAVAGVALAARGADLPALAALALAGALVGAAGWAVFGTLLGLACRAMADGAGTAALAQLGGLVHRMPGTVLALLIGAAGLASLPLSAGFPGTWLTLQALLAAPRIGGLALQAVLAVAAAGLGLALALAAAAAVRLVGLAALAPAGSPGAAAAREAARAPRVAMAVLSALALLLGVWPSTGVLLAQPALRLLLGVPFEGNGWIALAPAAETPGYAAPAVAALLAAAGAGLWLWRGPPARRTPPWTGGGPE